jgi:expansin (peptidoglycan-binding protein)
MRFEKTVFTICSIVFNASMISAAPDDGSITHNGEATYYAATGGGNCSFDASPENALLVGAMNELDYDNSTGCGSFVNITGPDGDVVIRIVDRCPECSEGDIDLSPDAFEEISPLAMGRIEISWNFVPGDITGPISYKFNDGSNEWWTSIQIRNHRTSIASVEIKDQNGNWAMLDRQMDNFFSNGTGYGVEPYSIRVTDIFNQQITDDNISFSIGGIEDGKANFPSPLAVKRIIPMNSSSRETERVFSAGICLLPGRNSMPASRVFNLRGRKVTRPAVNSRAPGLYIFIPEQNIRCNDP